LAALLSFLAPGVGQIYNGDYRPGWWLFVLFIGLGLPAGVVEQVAGGPLVALIELSLLSFRTGTAVAAFRRARRISAVKIGRYQKGWLYALLILFYVPMIILALMVRTFAYEPFNIPSGAMIPTLLVGDYLFVSKFSYGYSRYSLPFGLNLFSGRISVPGLSHPPQRGDVAVFKLPTDPSVDYIKRIVRLAGDHIQMRHGNLYINDQLVPRRAIKDYRYDEGGTSIVLHQYVEALPRGTGQPPLEHQIIKVGDNGPLDNTPVYEVPPDHYFAMGDNRDNSQDSRVLSAVGYIPMENFVGRAAIIFYSANGAATRFDRMLKAIH
jgi:signal peptidase I